MLLLSLLFTFSHTNTLTLIYFYVYSGKKGEDIELGQLVLKMEQDAQRAMQMRQSRSAAPRQEEAPTQAAPAPVAAAPVE